MAGHKIDVQDLEEMRMLPKLTDEQLDALEAEMYDMLQTRAGTLDSARVTATIFVQALIQHYGTPVLAYMVAQELLTRLFEALEQCDGRDCPGHADRAKEDPTA